MKVKAPDLGIDTAKVAEIMVKVGDLISKDHPIVLVESDKATVEIPSPVDGMVTAVFIQEDDDISEGTLLCNINENHAKDFLKEIATPKLPESVQDGIIASLYIKEGDKVKKDQVVAEIETDKVILEVVSPDDGVIAKIFNPEGSTVVSLEPIAQLTTQSSNIAPLFTQSNHQSKESVMSSNYIVISIQDKKGYRTQKIHFNELPMTIGRDRDCDICAEGTYVSAQHGKLYIENDHLLYEDFSKNGTYVNRTYINGRANQSSLPVSVSIRQNDKIILAGNQEGKHEDFPCIIIQEIQQGSDELFKLQSKFQNRLFNIFNQLQYDNKNPKLQGDVDDYISRCMPTLQIAKEVIGWTDEKLMKNAYNARILIYDMPTRSRSTPTPTHQEYVQPTFEPIKSNLKIIQDDKGNPIKISDNGNIFDLEELGGGGTSTVYRYNNQNSYKAIKIYTTQSTRVEYKEKLQVMLKTTPKSAKTVVNGQEYTQFVWPEALVFDDNGEVVGYLMPALPKHETYQLTTYVSGRENIEAKLEPNHHSIAYRIQVARNLAIAVQNLHEAGHYFIDIKPDNIFVFKDKCTVCLIDCDGFSIQQGKYPARHYSAGYRAPFVLQNDLKAIDLSSEPYQDYYCLSHIIFQILDFGNSPFNGGVNTTELEDQLMEIDSDNTYEYKVKNIWYPYQLDMKRDDIRPHKNSTFRSWPAGIRKLFDQAFLGDKWSVPKPIDWIDELNIYIQTQQFEKCQKEPNKTMHHHFKGMPCPICQLKDKVRPKK